MGPQHHNGTRQVLFSLCGAGHLVVEYFEESVRVLRTGSSGEFDLDPTRSFAVEQASTNSASYSLVHVWKGLSVDNGEESMQAAGLKDYVAIHISEAVS